jgi:hypothetical protein
VSRDLHRVSLDGYWLAGEGLLDLADSYLEGYRFICHPQQRYAGLADSYYILPACRKGHSLMGGALIDRRMSALRDGVGITHLR